MATFSLDAPANPASKKRACIVVPMLSRPIENDEDDELTDEEQAQVKGVRSIEGVESPALREKLLAGAPIPNWLGVITDEGVFNLSVDSRSDMADDLRADAMELPSNPADFGADCTIKGNTVYYEGKRVGKRIGYNGNVLPLSNPEEGAVKIVMKMSNSGQIVLTQNKAAGRGSQGLNFLGHGQQFVNNFTQIDRQHPLAQQLVMMYLTYVQLMYMDVTTMDAEDLDIDVKAGDALEDDQLQDAAEARFLIDTLISAWEDGPAEDAASGEAGSKAGSTAKKAQSAADAAGL